MQARHTNENKQFWPKYKIMTYQNMEKQHFYWKTGKFVYLALFMDIKGSN